jgi:hypothetical protein
MTSFISFIKKREIKKVLIRPHPKDDLYSFKNMINGIAKNKEYNEDNLVISKSKPETTLQRLTIVCSRYSLYRCSTLRL